MKVDLHVHTTASDGELSPINILDLANKNEIKLLAITDHDTTSSLGTFKILNKDKNIRIVNGIELSTQYKDSTVHLLGYFKDDSYNDSNFQGFLKDLKDYREYRCEKIVNGLKKYFNIEISYKELKKASKGVIARPHIAREIIKEGYPYSFEYIFNNIVSKDSPAYVENKKVSTKDGAALLKSLNAICVVAHPVLIKKIPLSEILDYEIDGIEAIYPKNSPKDTENFINIARKYNKIITAGSDFHSLNEKSSSHGSLGSMNLSLEDINIFIKKLEEI